MNENLASAFKKKKNEVDISLFNEPTSEFFKIDANISLFKGMMSKYVFNIRKKNDVKNTFIISGNSN